MIVTLIAVTALTLSALAPAEDPARLLPADTLIYFGSNSLKAGQEASRNTAMRRILDEPEMRSFLHQPTRAAEQVLASLMSNFREEMGDGGESLGITLPESFSLDITKTEEPLPFGQFFVGLTHIGMPGMPGMPMDRPDVGLVIGLELLDAAHVDLLKTLWSGIPLPESKGSHGGVDYLTRAEPNLGFGVSLAMLGQVAVITSSELTLHGVIDRSRGGDAASLATSADYQQILKAGGGLPSGGSSYIVRLGVLAPTIQMLLSLAAQDGMPPELSQKVLAVFDSIGLSAVQFVGGVSSVAADGKIHNSGIFAVDPASRSLIGKLMVSSQPIDVSKLSSIPRDCQSATLAHMGSALVTVYDFVMGAVESIDPDVATVVKSDLAKFMGDADLRNDVFANLNGPVMSMSLPGTSLMAQPESLGTVGLQDGPKLAAALRQIGSAALAMAGPQSPVKLKESDHEGTPFFEFELGGQLAMMGAMGFQPAFAVEGDRLSYSTSVRRLKTFLNGSLDTAKGSLKDDARFVAFVEGLSQRGAVTTLAYTNTKMSFGTMYGSVVSQLPMVGMFLGELPMDFSKLPVAETISKHLDASYAGSYSPAPGRHVMVSISEVQLADLLPMVFVLGLAVAGPQLGIDAAPMGEPTVDPLEVVQQDLRELKASLRVYKLDQGTYPKALTDLLQPLQEFPEGAYPHSSLPTDPWGNEYQYALVEKRGRETPMVWSFGPNGADDAGEGDDIVNL